MAGKHAAHAASGSKKKIIIIIVCVIAALGLIAGGIMFWLNSQGNTDTKKTAATTAPTVATTVTAASGDNNTKQTEAAAETTKSSDNTEETKSQQSHASQVVPDIQVPTQEGVDVTYFNGTYIPNGEAEDDQTGESVSLRDALGSGYSEGTLTFNSDGTFTDTIMSGEVSSGRYVVQNETITATYSDDRNMEITVSSWSNGAPAQFTVNYGGCIVHFG